MSIYPDFFYLYERLRSGKINNLTTQINSHVHDGTYGNRLSFDYLHNPLSQYILAYQIQDGIITGSMIQSNSISSAHILDSTIVMDDINTTSLHFDPSTGYAYYKP
jgi:hypothetical protein